MDQQHEDVHKKGMIPQAILIAIILAILIFA
jgi:hypothetical protein